jgi:hypothetical protein
MPVVTKLVVEFLASKVVFALKNDLNESIIKGNDAQENNRPIIIDGSVGSNEVGIKYSSKAPIDSGTIKKKGGAAKMCAESFSVIKISGNENYY